MKSPTTTVPFRVLSKRVILATLLTLTATTVLAPVASVTASAEEATTLPPESLQGPTITASSSSAPQLKALVLINVKDPDGVAVKKYAYGEQSLQYFETEGTTFLSSFITKENGNYTIYAKDTLGNESLTYYEVQNVVTPEELPVETAWYYLNKATESPTSINLLVAQTKITAVADGEEKEALSNAFATLQESVRYEQAQLALTQALRYKSDYYINRAETSINALTNEESKAMLTQQLNDFLQQLAQAQVDRTVKAMADATKYKTTYYINKAVDEINKLPDTMPEKSLWLQQMKEQTDSLVVTQAQTAVAMYQRYKTTRSADYYLTKARDSVDLLPDGELKTSLLAQLP